MIIDLTRLKNDIDKKITIKEIYSFDEEYIKTVGILKLDNININGNITKNSLNELIIDLEVSGIMVLPCSRTLEPVDYKFQTKIEGNLEEILKEINENDKKIENSIDILPIIWENILMEIPMRVISEKAENIELKGDGWKLITEEKKEDINPAFQKLNELFEEK